MIMYLISAAVAVAVGHFVDRKMYGWAAFFFTVELYALLHEIIGTM